MNKAIIIIAIIIFAMYYLVHRLKILNGYRKKYNEILILAAYKSLYTNPDDCLGGYRVPTLKEFELLYNENDFDYTQKYFKDD